MRDRLIELLEEAHDSWLRYVDECAFNQMALSFSFEQMVADHLLANGIVVPPVKVGDKVYRIWSVGKYGKSTAEFVVTNVSQIMENIWVMRYQKQAKSLYEIPTTYQCNFNDIGKTVFLTREQAEKALAERGENGT